MNSNRKEAQNDLPLKTALAIIGMVVTIAPAFVEGGRGNLRGVTDDK